MGIVKEIETRRRSKQITQSVPEHPLQNREGRGAAAPHHGAQYQM
jgi:hypothetical protein